MHVFILLIERTPISAIKTKFAQLTRKAIAENRNQEDFRMQVQKQLAQFITTQSSTKAEAIAAVTAAKTVRYV